MTAATAEVWKSSPVVEGYLSRRAVIPLVREQVEVMLALLSTRDEPVRRFLDLGCGDGVLAAAILDRFPMSHGVLLDFSEPMLNHAREMLDGAGNRPDFVLADYSPPDWRNALPEVSPFDAVVSGYSIHHQPDDRKRRIYSDIFELLGPGGWFINIEHVAPAAGITTRIFEDRFIDHEFAQEVKRGGSRSREQVAEDYLSRPDREANILASAEEQCGWLRQIGFIDVDCFCKIYELAVFGGRRPEKN